MTSIYIVRHGDKKKGDYYNSRLRHQDQPLSKIGLEQAQNLIPFFADKKITCVYVSAYQRTWQTIAHVSEHFNLAPIQDERLNEIDNGLFDGATEEELQEKFPNEWQAFRERDCDFRFPEGETGEEVRGRIAQFLDEKREVHSDENLIAVCHDGLIRILMCHVLGIPVYKRWNFQVDTCGITELTYQLDYEEWKLIRFNQTCV